MRLFLAHHRRLVAQICALVSNPVDADDVLQEVAIDLWQKFGQYDVTRDFGAWAGGFARNAVLRYHERRRHARKVSFDENLVRSLCDEMSTVAEEAESRHEALHHCMGKLPQKSRDLIHHRYAEGSSVLVIAQGAKSTVDAVYKALSRIHRVLLECVERQLAREGAR